MPVICAVGDGDKAHKEHGQIQFSDSFNCGRGRRWNWSGK